jgi:hypothetical protein
MSSEQLRQLAADLRKVAAQADTSRMIRCGETLKAANALHIIRKKVSSHAR